MDVPLPEIIDRITILKLKIEHSTDPVFTKEFEKELDSCNDSIEDYKNQGVKIQEDWFKKLYEINKFQWGLESSMRKLKNSPEKLKDIGKVYIELQISNKRRVAVKNEIADTTGSGFRDVKIN